MNRIGIAIIVILGLALALGFNVSALICAGAVLLLIAGAVGYMVTGKFIRHVWLMFLGLLIGPTFIAAVLRPVINEVHQTLGPVISYLLLSAVIIGAMTLSFLYVRSRIQSLT